MRVGLHGLVSRKLSVTAEMVHTSAVQSSSCWAPEICVSAPEELTFVI